MAEIDTVTQSNAANAEESAAASEEMNAQAEQMKNTVNELMAVVGGAVARNADGPKARLSVKKRQPGCNQTLSPSAEEFIWYSQAMPSPSNQ